MAALAFEHRPITAIAEHLHIGIVVVVNIVKFVLNFPASVNIRGLRPAPGASLPPIGKDLPAGVEQGTGGRHTIFVCAQRAVLLATMSGPRTSAQAASVTHMIR